jgi:hypothetical protein
VSAAGSADHAIHVTLPGGLPELTPVVARGLLAILIELTEVPVLDGPEEVNRDR